MQTGCNFCTAALDGETGHHLLVTNLVNRTQPLIRYEITDMIGISTERRPCGRPFPLLKSAEGRSDEILHLPDGHGGTVPVHPMHFHSPLAAAHEVRQYQVVHRDDEIALQIVLAGGASPERVREQVGEALSRKLRDAGADPPPLRFKFVESIARDPRTMSKLKLVRSETNHADGG